MYILTRKKEKILIDESDFELLNKYTWHLCSKGYARASINGKMIFMHRMIMNVTDKKIYIDHINRIQTDNRRCNLRTCNNSENQKNKKSSGKSKFIGVSIHISTNKYKNKKNELKIYKSKPRYLAHIKVNGKYMHLGIFDNEIEAALEYNKYALLYHKEFANLNVITNTSINN